MKNRIKSSQNFYKSKLLLKLIEFPAILNIEKYAPKLLKYKNNIIAPILYLKVIILFYLSINSVFVMDEFVQLGQAKYLGNGFFQTIWPVKAVGYTVFYKIAHLLGWNAVSTLLIGRLYTAALGCVIVAMIYASARALQASRTQALLVIVVLLSFSNFIERIFRTRAEPLAVFFAVASLLVVLRGGGLTARRIFVAGILTGLAFVTTQKSIYFNVALGLALVTDAAFLRDYRLALRRGVWLVAGWSVPVVLYCLVFGGLSPLPVAMNLFFGPVDLVTVVPRAYTGLERFIMDTLLKNALLYELCVAGMGLELLRIRQLNSNRRVALVFTVFITTFVFLHNQPWPYVFVMALPFMALWIYPLFQQLAAKPAHLAIGVAVLALAICVSFVRNVHYMVDYGNAQQLAVVRNAERLTGKQDRYFDGVGMLPNRSEPSTLWLDRPLVLRSLGEGRNSELYSIFNRTPPKTVIWSYRLDAVEPVIHEQLETSYVKVAANIRLPGRDLEKGDRVVFAVPIPGMYGLYSSKGRPLDGEILVDGKQVRPPVSLSRAETVVELVGAPSHALLVPEGSYAGVFDAQAPDRDLFAHVYD